jgi:hypothetical protein
MYISPPWAIALAVAAAMGVVIALAAAAHRGLIAAPERQLAGVAHLLGGGLAGFLALAFFPVMPLLAAVVGMLAIQAARTKRILDIGLLLSGIGATWTLMTGLAILNDLSDPAVTYPQGHPFFPVGIGVLVAGLVVLIADVARRRQPR